MRLLHGDCLELMAQIPDGSVDMVLCDLPYGTTACKWDSVIPFEPLWAEYRRVAKVNAAIVLTASQPFTTALIASNLKHFKYCWIWDKVRGVGFQIAKFRPMMRTEDVVVFGNGNGALATYNPQMVERDKIKKSKCYSSSDSSPLAYNDGLEREYTHKYPTNVIEASNASQKGKVHPTQKPVALMEYLIRTYTNGGETVLDNCMGSGTTGVACANTGRNFIGIEKDDKYFAIAKARIEAIGGEGLADAMGSLAKAAKAVRRTRARWDATGVWGLDGEARTALADALDIYEAVLRASSPKQMQIAQDERIRRLRKFT